MFMNLVASVLFILSLRGLSSAKTSRLGNIFGMTGMALAVSYTLFITPIHSYGLILLAIFLGGGIGAVIARKLPMTALPQLVAAFHSLVGLAAVIVAACALYNPRIFHLTLSSGSLLEMGLGTVVGAITLSGSVMAFGKLQGLLSGAPLTFPKQHWINTVLGCVLLGVLTLFIFTGSSFLFLLLVMGSIALGVLLILPIGGADMPVVVSLLNSYSGWAACGIGFTMHHPLLIITGALVGSSGTILSYIMCKGMNRSLIQVMLGGMGGGASTSNVVSDRPVHVGNPEDCAYVMNQAQSMIIVPGYGMAVAQAQHVLREMGDVLKTRGIRVRYAIHPVAGRMPGHMNVLLAEANVAYDDVVELEDINHEFSTTDVVLVIGANDVTNPAAKNDPSSPIYGMPILDVDKAKAVFFIKRSLGSGYAGIDNTLFYNDTTYMVLGDAKKVCEHILKSLNSQ